MEKNNGKVIAIVALLVGVVALSVGFAAFADELTIAGSANAKVGANPFDDADKGLAYLSSSPKCYVTGDTSKKAIDGASVGTASGDAWSGISVPLTKDAPSVTCEAVVENKTSYTAYLRGLVSSGGLTCTSSGANKTSNETNVCGGASATVTIGTTSINITNAAATASNVSGSIAPTSGTETVTVVIAYNPDVNYDEDTTITLPTITHSYSSAERDN